MNTSQIETSENQTVFSQEQVLTQAQQSTTNRQLPTQQKNTKTLVIIGCIVAFFFLMLLLIVASAARRTGPNTTTQPSPIPEAQQSATASSQLEKTLETLHKEIQNADPSINDLPFPPINGELFIQEQRL